MTAWITISVLAFLDSELLLVRGQADQANARAVDGFSSAVVQAGESLTRTCPQRTEPGLADHMPSSNGNHSHSTSPRIRSNPELLGAYTFSLSIGGILSAIARI